MENECAEEDFFSQEFPSSGHKPILKPTQHEMVEKALFSHEEAPPTSPISNVQSTRMTNVKKVPKKITFGVKKIGTAAQKPKDLTFEAEKSSIELDKEQENLANLSLANDEKDNNSSNAAPTEISSKFNVKQPITNEKKIQEKIKEVANDSNKTKIVDRLGMCGISRGGVSHSLSSGVRTIQQEGVSANKISTLKSSKDDYSDDWEVIREEE